MRDQPQSSGIKERLSLVNWPGLVAGVLMLVLPVLGAWWHAMAGNSVLEIGISPFYYNIVLTGQKITSSLVGYVLFAAKLTVWIGGIFLILGSVFSTKWWGRKLVSWGAMKIFWMIVSLVLLFTVGIFLANRFLPSLISRFIAADVNLSFDLPYLFGSGEAIIDQQNFSVIAPITISVTKSFLLAVVTAGLGVVTKIYNGRIEDKVSPEEESGEEEEVEEKTDEKTAEESEAEEENQKQPAEEPDEESREEKTEIEEKNEGKFETEE